MQPKNLELEKPLVYQKHTFNWKKKKKNTLSKKF